MSQCNQKEGDHYVVDGAIFKCQYGTVPCQIGVLSKPKAVVQNKAMVTENDVTFKSPSAPFVNCTQNPNKQSPICQYAKVVWVPNSTVKQGKQNAITESSKMKCPVFAGEISCIFHGQVQSVSMEDFKKLGLEKLTLAPFWSVFSMPKAEVEKKTVPIYSVGTSKLIVRANDIITLHAYKARKQKNELTANELVNWAISTIKEVKNNSKAKDTYLDKLMLYKNVGSPFNISLVEPGIYHIEGGSDNLVKHYSKQNYKTRNGTHISFDYKKPISSSNILPSDKDCELIVEVLENNYIQRVELLGDYAKERDNDTYILRSSEDIKIIVHTAVPLNAEEQLRLLIDKNLTQDIAKEMPITISGTPDPDCSVYSFTIKPSFFNNKNIRNIYVVLTDKNAFRIKQFNVVVGFDYNVLDFRSFSVKYVDGFVSASVSHDIFGKNPIPKDSYVRPDTTIFLTVSPAETSDKCEDLNDAVWEIIENKVCSEPKPKGSLAMHRLKKEGKVTVKLDLSGCNNVIKNKSLGTTHFEHTFNVSSNVIKGVEDTRKKMYTGIKYPIHFDLLYPYDVLSDNEKIKFKLDGQKKVLTSESFEVSFDKAGKHCVEYGKRGKFEFEVVDPSVQTWQFSDERHNRIDEVGLDETFYLDVYIPAWADYQKNVTKAGDGIGKVKFYLWANQGKESKIISIDSLRNAKMGDDGKAHIALKISKNELAIHLGTFNFPPKISIIASLINPPYAAAEILTAKKGYNGHWIYNNAIPLTLVTYPCVTGFFSGKSCNPQKSVMKYGDSVYIMLNTHNCKELTDKITVELCENNKEGDDDIFGNPFTNIEFDDNGKAKIDLSDLFADETAHGENSNPRLFYFRVKLDGKKIYEYPQTPADVFNMTYRKESEESKKAIVDIDGESHSISRSDDACDYESGLKIRSYLWQLKIGKDKEIEKLNQTLAMLAPVVVGEELRQGEKSTPEDCQCPRCHEKWEDLAKRLRDVFPDAKEANINIVAETYCKYARRFGMDSCWIKAHFFAQVYVESRRLEGKTESLDYSVKGLLKSDFPYFNGHLDRCEKYGRISEKKENGKYKDLPDNYKKTVKFQASKPEAIANIVYASKNGNKGGTDGWDYRGRGLIQLTGKGTYAEVGKILQCFGMDNEGFECDLVTNREKVATDLKLATITAMAFFRYKNCNMHVKCNGVEDADKISAIVGGSNYPLRKAAFKGGKGKFADGTEVDLEGTYKIFDVEHCDWKKIDCTENCPSYHTFFSGRVEKHIPKGCDEKTATHYIYYYHKEDGTVVEICRRTIVRDGLWELGAPQKKVTKPQNMIPTWNYRNEPDIDGDAIYILQNGDKVVVEKEKDEKKKKYGNYKFPKSKSNKPIELVKIDEDKEGFFEFKKEGMNLYYELKTNKTDRCYSDPNVFAIFIGILAELGANTEYDIKFKGTGNTERHGTGYPSVSHKNGVAFDFSYDDNKQINLALISAGYKFHCKTMLVGEKNYSPFSTYADGHTDHIHFGPFTDPNNKPIEKREK